MWFCLKMQKMNSMKFNVLTILLCLSIYGCGHAQLAINQEKIEATDQLFKRWATAQTPGAVMGLISKGELIYSKGYGAANLEHSIPNTVSTAFNIASNTKQFTAACISILNLRGELRFNQTLDEFFPDFPPYAKEVTVQHLLHHTSGLRDFSQITYLSGLRPDDYYDDSDILEWIGSQKELNFSPGEKFMYANSNYWLLGQIVQKVSGMPLSSFAKQEIFTPLNMSNTQFKDDNTNIIKNRAFGHSPNRSGGYRWIHSMLEHTGNGGIYTSVEDLAKWDKEFYTRKIFKDQFWETMMTQGILNNGEVIPYAKGLIMGNHHGIKTMDHGGRAPGYQSNIIRFPEEEFTIILLSNTSAINASQLSYQIADIFLEAKIVQASPIPTPERKKISLTTKQLEGLVGSYWNRDKAFSRKIVLQEGVLQYQRSRQNSHTLLPINATEFRMLDTPPGMEVIVRFDKKEMLFSENGEVVETFEQYRPIKYSVQELSAFTGKYFSNEINTYYELRLEKNDQLLLLINGKPTVPLRPVMRNLFSSPIGVFQFSEDGKGRIGAFKVSTPRVKNLAFKKG